MQKVISTLIFSFLGLLSFSQEVIDPNNVPLMDYSRPQEYVIEDIQVTGVRFLQPGHLITISGLSKGQKIKIPGPEISDAIHKYWKYGLFSDVQIVLSKTEGDKAYLEIQLTEQPRLGNLEIYGVNKTESGDLEEKINLTRGTQITENVLNTTRHIIKNHLKEKGFLNAEILMKMEDDTTSKSMVNLTIQIEKGARVKIEEIVFEGNEGFSDKRLRRVMKKTKQRDWNIFKGSKLLDDEYKEDKKNLISFYNERGYRDAKIVSEETYPINEKRIGLKLVLTEGRPYHIRSVNWIGNAKYPSSYLDQILGMKAGDVYDQKMLNDRLTTDEDAITSLYMDNGYLFFNVSPVEANIENDSVDLELRIYEGKQASLNNIIIKGNTKTNEHVIRRELYTRPGELFSRADIIRSVRELATLGHFNPETITPNPIPNPADGTVDIEYSLEERANDQLELSGGWGGYYGFMGTIGIKFSNFSMQNFFEKEAWRPVPSGDGQTLSIRAQASGKSYQSYNISFVEPWFGGKKPNSLSVSLYCSNLHTNYAYSYQANTFDENDPLFRTLGGAIGLGRRLKWPDDYFSLYNEIGYKRYFLHNYRLGELYNGDYNLLSFKTILSRSSQDQMIYPRRGSSISLSLEVTPPYSAFTNTSYAGLSAEQLYKNVEFYKWNFKGDWFTSLVQNLVLAMRAEFGYLGFYNDELGAPPFERFRVGGDGLSGYSMSGTDIIKLRGYENGRVLTGPINTNGSAYDYLDANIYTRYYAEFRYPFSLNPSATIYGLAFLEGGNAWQSWNDFNPFAIKRAAGLGLRAFLPMFGLLGVDYGYGFDPNNDSSTEPSAHQWHFVIGQEF